MIRECWDRKETYSTFLGGMAWGGVGIEMNRFIGWGGICVSSYLDGGKISSVKQVNWLILSADLVR